MCTPLRRSPSGRLPISDMDRNGNQLIYTYGANDQNNPIRVVTACTEERQAGGLSGPPLCFSWQIQLDPR